MKNGGKNKSVAFTFLFHCITQTIVIITIVII